MNFIINDMSMKLENQVCSLEQAKKLKELGVKQESLFYWSIPKEECIFDNPVDVANHRKCEPLLVEEIGRWGEGFYDVSAYTVAELGELLPETINHKSDLSIKKCKVAIGWCHIRLVKSVSLWN